MLVKTLSVKTDCLARPIVASGFHFINHKILYRKYTFVFTKNVNTAQLNNNWKINVPIRTLKRRRKEYLRLFDFSTITHVHTQKPSAVACPDMLQVSGSVFELPYRHCVESVQIQSCFWSVFFRIRSEYGEIRSISPYSLRLRENTDQK